MNVSMNDLGFGLAGGVIILIVQVLLPFLRKLITGKAASAPASGPAPSPTQMPHATETLPWWLTFVVNALEEIHKSHCFVVSVQPKEERSV